MIKVDENGKIVLSGAEDDRGRVEMLVEEEEEEEQEEEQEQEEEEEEDTPSNLGSNDTLVESKFDSGIVDLESDEDNTVSFKGNKSMFRDRDDVGNNVITSGKR